MLNNENRKIGFLCEGAAKKYLEHHGFCVIDRNFTVRGGEIDLVCKADGVTVFAEVKARKSCEYGTPAEAVTRRKQEKLIYAANRYIEKYNISSDCRFDVIEVLYRETEDGIEAEKINHIENAFEVT